MLLFETFFRNGNLTYRAMYDFFPNLDGFHGLRLTEIQSSGLVLEDPHSLGATGSGSLQLQTVNFDDLQGETNYLFVK